MKISSIIALILFANFGCSKEDSFLTPVVDDPSIATANGTWKVISYEDHVAERTEIRTKENSWEKEILITFDDNVSPPSIIGVNTTNTFRGEFEYAGPRKFKIDKYVSTYVNEPKWGQMFTSAVVNGDFTFGVNAQKMRIYYAGGAKSITMEKQ